jgi:hypothetical protein
MPTPVPRPLTRVSRVAATLPHICELRTYVSKFRLQERTNFGYVNHGDGTVDVSYDGRPYVCVRPSSIPGAGLGVYACRDFDKNAEIGVYTGRVMGWVGEVEKTTDDEYLTENTVYVTVNPVSPKHAQARPDTPKHAQARPQAPKRWRCLIDGSAPPQDAVGQLHALGLKPPFVAPFNDLDVWPGMHAHLMNDASGPRQVPGLVNNCRMMEDGVITTVCAIPGSGSFERVAPENELFMAYGQSYWEGR